MLSISKFYKDHDNYFRYFETRGDYYLTSACNTFVFCSDDFKDIKKQLESSMSNLGDYKRIINELRAGKVGELEVKRKNKAENHRAGLDFCFSIPKELSFMLLDKNLSRYLIDAHQEAIKKTLDVMRNYIRVRDSSGKFSEKTDSFFVSAYTHLTSRDLDPQLHTHVLFYNFTKVGDKLKAIDYSLLYKERKNFDFLFQNYLVENLKNSFLQTINIIDKKNLTDFFYINDNYDITLPLDKNIVKLFSKRSEDVISSVLKAIEEGQKLTEESLIDDIEKIVLYTRKPKEALNLEDLRNFWRQQLREKFYSDDVVENYKETILYILQNIQKVEQKKQTTIKEDRYKTVLDSFEKYLRAEKKVYFSRLDVFRFAKKYCQEEKNIDINFVFDIITKQSQKFFDKRNSCEFYVAGYYSKYVSSIYQDISEMKSKRVYFSKDLLSNEVEEIKLSKQQKRVFDSICNNFLTVVDGAAGTGKSSIIKKFDKNQVVSIAYTHLAAKNIPASKNFSVHSLLGLNEKNEQEYSKKTNELKNKIVVIDEASMIPIDLMTKMLSEIKNSGAKRVVLMGDNRQIEAINDINVFDIIVEKTNALKLNEIHRQQEGEYRNFAKALASNHRTRDFFIEDFLKKNNKDLNRDIIKHAIENDIKIVCNNNEICRSINEIYLKYKKNREYLITKNDYKLNVFNGDVGIKKGDFLVFKDGRKVKFSDVEAQPFFAITVAKSQGQTFEKCYYIPTANDDSNTAYVAATRARREFVVLNTEQCDYKNVIDNLKSLNRNVELKFQKKNIIFEDLKVFASKLSESFAKQFVDRKRKFDYNFHY